MNYRSNYSKKTHWKIVTYIIHDAQNPKSEIKQWIIIYDFMFSQTYIGEVLISVNPYKLLSIYDEKLMFKYCNKTHVEETPHMWVSNIVSWIFD